MFNGNLSLHGIDRDLRHQELQDPTFLFKGETIKTLADFLLEHGKVLDQPEVLVLLLALVCKPLHFSLNALDSCANVLKARRDFF